MATTIQVLVTAMLVTTSSRAMADVSPGASLLATGYSQINITGAVFQINASTGVSREILPSQSWSIFGVGWDPVRLRVYWGDRSPGSIESASLNGSVVRSVRVYQLPGCAAQIGYCGSPNGLAVDYLEQLVFYVDSSSKRIAVVSTDGSNHRVLLSTEGLPYGLALDLLQEVVYYTVYIGPAMIGRVSYNGSAHAVVVRNLPAQPSGITLDRKEGRLYWCSFITKRIDSVRTDGTDRRTVLQEASTIYGLGFLAVLGDTLYFSDYERSVKTDGTGVSLLVSLPVDRIGGVTAFDPNDVVTLTQKRDASITSTTQSVTTSSEVRVSTDVTHVSDITPGSSDVTIIPTRTMSFTSGTTRSVTTSSEIRVSSDVTHGSDVTPGSSDVTIMPTRTTTIAADTPDSPLVIVALSVGLLVFVLVLVVAVVVVYRRKNSIQRSQTGNGGDLMAFPGNDDEGYATPGSVSSHLPPPLLPVRPVDYSFEREVQTASSGESIPYGDVARVPWSQPSLSRGEVAGGGRYKDSGRDFSSDCEPYTSVTPLHPERSAEPGTASMAVNQENTSASALASSFENAAFEEESSGNSLPYLSVSSINGLTPEEMAGNVQREITPPPPCGRQPFRVFPTDVTSSAVESVRGNRDSVESTPYMSVAVISQSQQACPLSR